MLLVYPLGISLMLAFPYSPAHQVARA